MWEFLSYEFNFLNGYTALHIFCFTLVKLWWIFQKVVYVSKLSNFNGLFCSFPLLPFVVSLICNDILCIILVSVIHVFFLLGLATSLLILLTFKGLDHFLVSLIFLDYFYIFNFIDCCSYLYYFSLLALDSLCSMLLRLSKYEFRLLIWDFSSSLLYAFSYINVSFSTSVTESHKFWYIIFSFPFNLRYHSISWSFFFDSWVI